jgi:uncharacterized protein YbjT (DUF2867 family)
VKTFLSKPTIVMGARGSVGSCVLDQLVAAGLPVRASARRPEPGQFPAGLDVRAADVTDAASLRSAFDGVGQIFLYANLDGVEGVVDSARAAGVERIVLMSSGSVIHPSAAGNAITEQHRAVETAFAAAVDLKVIPIRPLVLASNALWWARSIRANGSLALYQPDALTAPIHERDIAAVAVSALTGNESPSVSGLLTGPERISQRAQVAIIAMTTGREVKLTELSRSEALEQFVRYMPMGEAEAVLQFIDDAAAGNCPATGMVEQLLGRPAIDFTTWTRDHIADFS